MRVILAALLLMAADVTMAQLQLAIGVEPSTTLPGITPSLRIHVRNTGSVAAELPTPVALSVTVADNEPFLAGKPGAGNHVTADIANRPGESTIIPAGEVRDFTLWTAGNSSPPWFVEDVRLAFPGTYRLQLIAGVEYNGPANRHTVRTTPTPPPAPITSNEVVYTISEPQGEDAAVWAHIRELPNVATWSRDLASKIWESHPNSTYAAYCVPPTEPAALDRTIDLYEQVIKRQSDPVTADAFRLTLAEFLIERVFNSVIHGDLAEATADTERARALFSQLAKDASDPQTRQSAEDKLRTDVRSRSELIEDIEAAQGRFPKDVRPGVDCMESQIDGRSVIWFAYQNPSRDPITEPIGARNKFTPPPFSRSQPTSFSPGVHHLVFSVPADVPELTWHLQKSQLVVKVRDVPLCSAEDLAQYRAWRSATP